LRFLVLHSLSYRQQRLEDKDEWEKVKKSAVAPENDEWIKAEGKGVKNGGIQKKFIDNLI